MEHRVHSNSDGLLSRLCVHTDVYDWPSQKKIPLRFLQRSYNRIHKEIGDPHARHVSLAAVAIIWGLIMFDSI